MKKIFASLLLTLCCVAGNAQNWTGTFATAVERPFSKSDMPKTTLSGNTLREIVHVSLGGEKLRVKLSNEFGDSIVDIKSIYISSTPAIPGGGESSAGIVAASAKYLTFSGKKSVSIEKEKTVWSDAINYKLKPLQLLAITINYGKTPKTMTTHRGSRTNSYLAAGEVKPKDAFNTVEKFAHWYTISSISVDGDGKAVAILGNSITDGRGSTTDAQNRWTDRLAEALGGKVGVLNLGIGGNCVVQGGISQPGVERFDRDILGQEGIDRVIIYEGINDIGGCKDSKAELTSRRLITAFKELAKKAHDKGLKVYGATITPFGNNSYFSLWHEAARQTVNNWIRTAKELDGFIDFDECVRDPQKKEQLLEEYSDDWLHLNPKGYEAMGKFAAERLNK